MVDDETGLRTEIARLNKVVQALMNRAERSTDVQGSEFSLFQATVMLEEQVQARTAELVDALRDNEKINRDLTQQREEQHLLIGELGEARTQLAQSEMLASVGQLAAGVAHEVNNPIAFVHSNLGTLKTYVGDVFALLDRYIGVEQDLPPPARQSMVDARREADLDFLRGDIVALIDESAAGTARVRNIVQALRDFARPGESETQVVDVHTGIESTLTVAWNELKDKADVVRDYGNLPPVECMPSQLNQVFLSILINAAQAIPLHGTITIRTRHEANGVSIAISDTGIGMTPDVRSRIFEPFFTTKPVGQGAGLGLSSAYGIIEKHGGRIDVASEPGKGTTVTIHLPQKQG